MYVLQTSIVCLVINIIGVKTKSCRRFLSLICRNGKGKKLKSHALPHSLEQNREDSTNPRIMLMTLFVLFCSCIYKREFIHTLHNYFA